MGEGTSDGGIVEGEDGAEASEAESGNQNRAKWAALIDVFVMEACYYASYKCTNTALGGGGRWMGFNLSNNILLLVPASPYSLLTTSR